MSKALEETVGVLGESLRRMTLSELDSRGVSTKDNEFVDADAVMSILHGLFGRDAADLIMEKICIRSDELASNSTATYDSDAF